MRLRRSPWLIQHPSSAQEISNLLDRLLQNAQFILGDEDPLLHALAQITARYGEVVTQCVNASADLHLRAFSELLGGQPRLARAAQVNVSFTPAAGAARQPDGASRPTAEGCRPVTVPMHTRLATQAGNDGEAVIFETMADVELIRAEAVRALFTDAGHRFVADVSGMVGDGLIGDVQRSFGPVTYALHIGHRTGFAVSGLQTVGVQVDVQDAGVRDLELQMDWIVATPNGDVPLVIVRDTTGGLVRSGEVVVVPPSAWPAGSVNGSELLWLTLRLRQQSGPVATAAEWRPPRLSALQIYVFAATGPQAVAAACHDGIAVDTSKDLFPFGERPRFGSVFQVLCAAFGEQGSSVEMIVRLTNPEGAIIAPIATVSSEGRPTVLWEIATTSGFKPVAAEDGTKSLTQDGSLFFTVPGDVASVNLAGKNGPWLRARLVSGDYGSIQATNGIAISVPRAPSIKSIAVRSTLERGPLQPEHLVSQGALMTVPCDPRLPTPIDLFPLPEVGGPALYIGLDAIGSLRALDVLAKGYVISWHVLPSSPTVPVVLGDTARKPVIPRWQMRGADGWCDSMVHDGSDGLRQSGIVRLTLPEEPSDWLGTTSDPAPRKLVWLRVVWPAFLATDSFPPLPVRLTINSVAARHSQRLVNEVVGSSNGRPGQIFRTLRTPVVDHVDLQVREADDRWTKWNEVDTLAKSHAGSRNFTLDRSTGELRFGDGRHGRIPPPGANNVRMHRYNTGGGYCGNQPARSITLLRSAIPSVGTVINHEPACGGMDRESDSDVQYHASAWLRHRNRAVCADDFSDLAFKASPQIARAFCIDGRDLGVIPPMGAGEPELLPGVVSIIVIPRTGEQHPQPGFDLLNTVRVYLETRRPPVCRLVVVGPTYTSIGVQASVSTASGWSPGSVADDCRRRVAAFLHPLAGGEDGFGWALGRLPQRSDLFDLLDGVDGVGSIHGLDLTIDTPTGMPIIVAAGAINIEPVRAT